MTTVEHERLTAWVRAGEYKDIHHIEVYRRRLAQGCNPSAGSRLLADRGLDARKITDAPRAV